MTARRIDNFEMGAAVPWTTGYTVRVTNGFAADLAMVHVRVARRGNTTMLHRIPMLAPGDTVAVPAGTMADLAFYEIVAYDAHGHAIARLPASAGAISPVEAANQLPARPDEHTDDWVLSEAHLLGAGDIYVVEIVNNTPDTWEGVTVSYGTTVEGTRTVESSPVSPSGRVRFDLAAAGTMIGYTFSIWVDGLRAMLADGALQFPPSGVMTAQLAAETNGDLHPTRDTWTIGGEP